MTLMENVPQLIKDDDRHGLFSSAAELAEEGKIPLLGTFELTDTLCKGKSQRCRSWFQFEVPSLTMLLPAWTPPVQEKDSLPMNDVLIPAELIPLSSWLQGKIELLPFVPSRTSAVVAATITVNASLKFGTINGFVGDIVQLVPAVSSGAFAVKHKWCNRWRVLSHDRGFLTLLRAQRK